MATRLGNGEERSPSTTGMRCVATSGLKNASGKGWKDKGLVFQGLDGKRTVRRAHTGRSRRPRPRLDRAYLKNLTHRPGRWGHGLPTWDSSPANPEHRHSIFTLGIDTDIRTLSDRQCMPFVLSRAGLYRIYSHPVIDVIEPVNIDVSGHASDVRGQSPLQVLRTRAAHTEIDPTSRSSLLYSYKDLLSIGETAFTSDAT